MVGVSAFFHLPIEHVQLKTSFHSWGDVTRLIAAQIPPHFPFDAVRKAAFYGFEFALISYLDTLMVAAIMDRISGEKTKRNKELAAQGTANFAVGLIGGVPGTQASIRSVMMLQEGATLRAAGMLVGVFVILGMLLFQQFIELIPKAVFMGILLKVGWNVCDRAPLWAFVSRAGNRPNALAFLTILGTALVTVYNLCLAVVVFTAFYYAGARLLHRRTKPHTPVADQLKDIVDDSGDAP